MNPIIDAKQISKFFTALGDPNRLQIVTLLQSKPLNVSEIAQHFPKLSRPAISHHLKVLKEADILDSEKSGQEVYYALNADAVITLLRALADKLERRSENE